MGLRNYADVYEFEAVLPGNGQTVKFKPMTTKTLKRLLLYKDSTEIYDVEKAFDEMLTACIVDDTNINDLYTDDRFYLLAMIRAKSKGSIIEFQWDCPKCNNQSLQIVDIEKFPVKKKPEDIKYEIEIDDKVSISLDFFKRQDQIEAEKILLSRTDIPSDLREVEYGTFVQASAIKTAKTPEGEETPSMEDKVWFLDNLNEKKYEKITQWYEDNKFGMDLNVKFTCPHCNYVEKSEVDPGDIFF